MSQSSKRKPIGKKLRFEVFKRDRFTCQYCGKQAPDVVLHVDHLDPVSKGGGNDILNLVTSCSDCNMGKGAREISDDAEIKKQRAQLEELSERRDQLEAMVRWRDEIRDIDASALESIELHWEDEAYPSILTATGRASLKKLLNKFGFAILSEAITRVSAQYIKFNDEGATNESAISAFHKLGGVCYFLKNPEMRDDKDMYYIRGILRNRLTYVNERMAIKLMREAKLRGIDMGWLRDFAKEVSNWTEFRDVLEDFIVGEDDGQN